MVIDPPLLVSSINKISKKEISGLDKEEPDNMPEDYIAFEVNTKKFQKETSIYILQIEKKNELLKSYPYPPTSYYTFWKFDKHEKGKFWYFPNDTYNDELLYKWAYTKSWIGKWYEDSYWRYIWGFDAVDSPMEIFHPLNDVGYYRLGLAIYYDDSKYFHPMSY